MAAPAIGLRRRWTPPLSATIEWTHPLAQGLVTCWWPGVVNDKVDGAVWSGESSTVIGSGPFGRSRSVTTSAKITRVANPLQQQTGSIMIVQRLTAAPATDGNGIGNSLNDTTNRWGAHLPYGDSTIYFDIANTSTGRLTYAGWTWGNWDVFVLTNGATGGQSIWGNGLRLANDSVATSSGFSGSWGLGQHAGVSNTNTNQVAILAAWRRELLAGEVAKLTEDPFCFLRS